jgi:leucyl aminopeptidase
MWRDATSRAGSTWLSGSFFDGAGENGDNRRNPTTMRIFKEQRVEFSIKAGTPEKLRSGCIAVGVIDAKKLTPAAAALDRAAKGYLAEILRRGDLDAKAGATLALHNVPGTACERVLLVSLGKDAELSDKDFRGAIGATAKALAASGAKDAVICFADHPVAGRDARWNARQAAMLLADSAYRYDATKSKKDENRRGPAKITLLIGEKTDLAAARSGMAQGQEGPRQPAGQCLHAGYLASRPRRSARNTRLKVDVLDRATWKSSAWVRSCRSRPAPNNRPSSSS